MQHTLKKRLFIFLTLLALAAFTTLSLFGCANDIKALSGKFLDLSEMSLVFDDDFKTGFDTELWTSKKYWDSDHEYIRRGGYWDEEQCFPDGQGNLVIRTEKKNGKYGEGYYTGMLNTRGLKEFTYGYFEVRMKAPKAQGLWSAFWLLSDSFDKIAGGGAEIDIVETPFFDDPKQNPKHYKNTAFHTIHIDGYGDDASSKGSPKYPVQNDIYDTFNTYGVMWTETEYVFYVNGEESWRTSFGVSDSPQYMILSIEIAGEHSKAKADPANPDNKFCWSGEITKNSPEALPADFVIDYVRVYQ